MTDQITPSNIKIIKDYFGLSAKDAMTESKLLTAQDKEERGEGIRNGSLTY